MKREGTIAATFLAIAAVVGFSLQSGPKTDTPKTDGTGLTRRSKPALQAAKNLPGCSSLQNELQDFLETTSVPSPCSEKVDASPSESQSNPDLDLVRKTSQLKFIIAILPDPVHTHLPVLFDQFTAAIEEGAQDEKYDFDSSWLPWDEEDTPYELLADEKASNFEKELKENQPGIILFRKALGCPRNEADPHYTCKERWDDPATVGGSGLSNSYRQGLVVFVVGEDATHCGHRGQFRNALAWIKTLEPKTGKPKPLAVLGPSFSGSLPSLSQMLSEEQITKQLDLLQTHNAESLAIYSGSISSKPAAEGFHNTFKSHVRFHSFVQNDDEILRRFCKYIRKEQSGFDSGRVAIISEDQTAYGRAVMGPSSEDGDNANACPDKALKLYYPRDISALRGAYQTKSLFDTGTSAQSADTQRRSLPTALADPRGTVHDSIRSYGGNQTPLTQEAFLMEIVTALRELRARYILLRSSNTLDQLFLTNFLRRSYPDARIVILGSDLMFVRERGATGLSGTMTLSTYPLFPLARDWTEHQTLPASDRVFSADTSEGTYIAFRLLLNDSSLNDASANADRCQVIEENEKSDDSDKGLFLPRISCTQDPPVPDYSAPFWMVVNPCGELKPLKSDKPCSYPGPGTWLSVIGVNRFWPMASLTEWTPDKAPSNSEPVLADWAKRPRATERDTEPGGRPEMPLGMKVFFLCLLTFSLFHVWCCWSGSFTAKPSFLAHFATTGDLASHPFDLRWKLLYGLFGHRCRSAER